ncbi:MAG TPA: HNH endonuclease signature motif containing protein [Acidimicrobiia bacterium]|nr:HNH endonuclease signature motif containing protein [Acidimicrobiia bacterium]
MPKRACLLRGPKCDNGGFAVPGGSRCPAHGGYKSNWGKYKAKHPDRAANYQSEGWRRLRDRVLREEPNCRRCGAPSSDVDHIVPLADGGGFFDRENLQALCHPCHKVKTGVDNRRRRTKR